jgi:hypothetical protein
LENLNDLPATDREIRAGMLEKFMLWNHFREKAALHGYSTNEALVRLIQRFIARGFDDGEPEVK